MAMAIAKLLGLIAQMESSNRIREQRKAKGLTLEELSSIAGISVTHLQRMERGERNVSLKNLEKIAAALNLAATELLVGSQTNTSATKPDEKANSEIGPYLRPILEALFVESFGQDRTQAQSWARVVLSAAAAAQAVGVVPAEQEARRLLAAMSNTQFPDQLPKQ